MSAAGTATGKVLPNGTDKPNGVDGATKPNSSDESDDCLYVSETGTTFPAKRAFPVKRVQDSLTAGELKAYEAIWHQIRNSGFFRILSIEPQLHVFQAGYAALARICGLSERSIRNILPKLIEKCVLSLRSPARLHRGRKPDASVYEIYGYQEILIRQRANGWHFAVKSGPAVVLVTPSDSNKSNRSGVTPVSSMVAETATVAEIATPAMTSTVCMEDSARSGVANTAMPSKDILLDNQTDFDVDEIEKRLGANGFRNFDRQAIRQIWIESREIVPDVSAEEVAELFIERAQILIRNPRIDNLNGVVLKMWRVWITPIYIEDTRRDKRRAAERQAKVLEETRAFAENIIADPESSESELRIARRRLDEMN